MTPAASRWMAVGGLLGLSIAAIGAMHTGAGRQLLARLGVPCPVDQVDAAQVTRLREAGLRDARGLGTAPARPALGMVLGRTTREDVRAWQAAHRAECVELVRGATYLRCRGVAADAFGVAGPPVSEAWFSFGPDGRLAGVDLYRRGLDDPGAVQAWSDAQARLARALGTPTRAFGDASPRVLHASALQTARLEYRYRDYLAVVTAVNLPHAGLAVREQYIDAR